MRPICSALFMFEAFFDALTAMSQTAHLVQMFDFTVVRAHASAAGAKGRQDGQALGRSRGGFSTKIHLKVNLETDRGPPCPPLLSKSQGQTRCLSTLMVVVH